MPRFEKLFEPFDIPPVHLKNRIVMTPLFTGYAHESGEASVLTLEHYRRIAAGGASMIVVANVSVDPDGALSKNSLRIDSDRFVPGLGKLAQTIKSEGCAAVVQINHGGRFARSQNAMAPSPVAITDINLTGFYQIALKSQDMERKWSILSDALDKKPPRHMTPDDIRRVIGAYADAAVRARRAGFDMVEIHGATGYLPVQFLSPRTNLRTDRYGGDADNRARFCLELIEAVKKAAGDDFPVGWRFLADEWMPGGFGIDDAEVLARRIDRLGIAYLSATAGVYEAFSNPETIEKMKKPCYLVDLSRRIKRVVKAPVIVSGRILTPELAEDVLKREDSDLIGLARPLLIDPDWPEKARTGRENTIKVCGNCGACFRMVVADRPVLCSLFDKKERIRRKHILKEMRNPNKKVLLAMDGSEHAAMGAAYAADMLCGVEGIQITIIHISTEETEQNYDEIREMLEVAKNILIEKGISGEAVTVSVKKRRSGVAGDILDEIEAGGFGTVVVGRRGLSMARRLLFGSVSDKIVKSARDCTVWVVD